MSVAIRVGSVVLNRLMQFGRSMNPLQRDFRSEAFFLAILGFTTFYFTALFSYNPFDPSPFSATFPPQTSANLAGELGSILASYAIFYWGLGAALIPIPFVVMMALLAFDHPKPFGLSRFVGWLCGFAVSLFLLQQYVKTFQIYRLEVPAAGYWGTALSAYLIQTFGKVGQMIIMATLLLMSVVLTSRQKVFVPLFRKTITRHQKPESEITTPPVVRTSWWSRFKRKTPPAPLQDPMVHLEHSLNEETARLRQDLVVREPVAAMPSMAEPTVALDPQPMREPIAVMTKTTTKQIEEKIPSINRDTDGDEEKIVRLPYAPPSANIFRASAAAGQITESQRREFERTAAALESAFKDFGINGKVVAVQPGPVVTVFEFEADAGTKLAKITGLLDDIALAMRVDSIFIHPVSGKRAVGIQVPNSQREMVFLGDILNAREFKDSLAPLTFAMGKSLQGDPVCADLATMPHLLMAGQTGSGKSVAINSLLCSVIMKASPDEVRMILVDPKILELKIYEGIPHLLMPVITEASRASLALKWACQEMDRRYRLMEMAKVRHIAGFNKYWDQASESEKRDLSLMSGEQNLGRLSFILIVIDELADLMLTAPKDVENSIQRLAQKARASGIHLVLATQRPSVDVITGVIKANLPCRIAFKVFSRVDSRTILDCMGAERLLGKGDMLYLRPGSSKLERIQGTYIEDAEVNTLVDAIKGQYHTEYDDQAIAWIDSEVKRGQGGDDSGMESVPDGDDPKWDEALAIAQRQGFISASFLQRSLKIGYNRAARMVEQMEAKGLVGGADGAKPRKWLGGSL